MFCAFIERGFGFDFHVLADVNCGCRYEAREWVYTEKAHNTNNNHREERVLGELQCSSAWGWRDKRNVTPVCLYMCVLGFFLAKGKSRTKCRHQVDIPAQLFASLGQRY